MAKNKALLVEPQFPECKQGCAGRLIRETKKAESHICGENLKVVTIVEQLYDCSTCGEEFSRIVSATEN